MRIFSITILFSCMLASCIGQTTNRNGVNTKVQNNQSGLKQNAEQIKKVYTKLLTSGYAIKDQNEYFETFPNSFVLLNNLFGYSDKEPLGVKTFDSPLYEESEKYISAFFKLKRIDKTLYYNRIIDISINGRWYADGVNYFKHGAEEKVKADINLFCELLTKRSDKEIKSFWYFYFDSPHPIKVIPEELQKVKEIDNRVYSLMGLALEEVQHAWED